MSKSVFGLAKDEGHADRIVSHLLSSGFTRDHISVLYSKKEGELREVNRDFSTNRDFSEDTTLQTRDISDTSIQRRNVSDPTFQKDREGTLAHKNQTKAPEGATTGALSGGIVGGSLGLLAGIGALAIPGLGPFIAAGPIMAALAGSAIGGSVGLLVGALVGAGIPEYEAKKLEEGLKTGGVLICVETENSEDVENAEEILRVEGATDISTSRETTQRFGL